MIRRAQSTGDDGDGRRRFQFSVRDLLQLMLAVAVISGVGAVCRESEQFQGIYCLWSLLAVLLVGAIWIVYRIRLAGPRMLAYGSLVIYLLSLFVPVWNKPGFEFGVGLMWMSTISTLTLDVSGAFIGRWVSAAIVFGGVANLAFLVGYLSLLVGIRWRGGRRIAGWCAALSVVAALATVPALSLDAMTSSPVFPTFCLWLASPWALWLGSRGMKAPAADGNAAV